MTVLGPGEGPEIRPPTPEEQRQIDADGVPAWADPKHTVMVDGAPAFRIKPGKKNLDLMLDELAKKWQP